MKLPAGLAIVAFFVLAAILAPLITFHYRISMNLPDRHAPPFWLEGGAASHPLGTDQFGRDV
jgi:ABC-type dipeptide/oligopeptide/nickel transport system permease subunit